MYRVFLQRTQIIGEWEKAVDQEKKYECRFQRIISWNTDKIYRLGSFNDYV